MRGEGHPRGLPTHHRHPAPAEVRRGEDQPGCHHRVVPGCGEKREAVCHPLHPLRPAGQGADGQWREPGAEGGGQPDGRHHHGGCQQRGQLRGHLRQKRQFPAAAGGHGVPGPDRRHGGPYHPAGRRRRGERGQPSAGGREADTHCHGQRAGRPLPDHRGDRGGPGGPDWAGGHLLDRCRRPHLEEQ